MTYTPPSGPGTIRYVDIDPTLQMSLENAIKAVKGLAGDMALVLPPASIKKFDLVDFASGYYSGLQPTNVATNQVVGLFGAGAPADRNDLDGTIIEMVANSSTKGPNIPTQQQGGVNPAHILSLNGNRYTEVAGFGIIGTPQGHNYSSFLTYNPQRRMWIHDLRLLEWYGDAGLPPGETTGLQLQDKDYHFSHLVEQIQVDGRDVNGVAQGSGGLGGQNLRGTTDEPVVFRNSRDQYSRVSQTGMSLSRYVEWHQVKSWYHGSPGLTGHGQNFENCHAIELYNSSIMGNTGKHVAFNNYGTAGAAILSEEGVKGTMTIYNPLFDDQAGPFNPREFVVETGWSDKNSDGTYKYQEIPTVICEGNAITPRQVGSCWAYQFPSDWPTH